MTDCCQPSLPVNCADIGQTLRHLLPRKAAAEARLIWMANFEAERYWAAPQSLHLPSVSQMADVAIVNRMEEMSLFLAQAPDLLILREPSEAAFVDYVAGLGLEPPRVITSSPADSTTPIAETVLRNGRMGAELRQLMQQGDEFYLLPYATTCMEEQIADLTGIPCLGPPAAVCAKVNSKIYSRIISRDLGLTTVPGGECDSLESLEAAYLHLTQSGPGACIAKEALGVSGRGLFFIDSPARMVSLLALLKRRQKLDSRLDFVLERWIDKEKDINYQIFVAPSGEVQLLNVKEAVTRNGVHMGHRWPAEISSDQRACYENAAIAVGQRLWADGFTGIVGIDSMIDRQGTVYPVLEINARFNMSTYEFRLDSIIEPAFEKVVKYYPFTLRGPLQFEKLCSTLGPDLFRSGSQPGIGVFCFATANCNLQHKPSAPAKGRIYCFIAGPDANEISRLDDTMRKALEVCGAVMEKQL
jgi:pre ATP-grasp domain-containing protein/carbamoyl-phosphate synthase L subunit-like protein